ncbi:MAG: hypothetical protein NTW78_11435 [Campylobacterales bacterium]|nr:hypothetical protein [Campylobacterales bacterium]
MTFDFNQLINKNFEQILKNHLGVDSLENYDIKIELLPQRNNQLFFSIYFNLTYKLTLLKDNLLAITAISKPYNNQKISLINQNHFKKLYDNNSIDFATINYFRTTDSKVESKRYSLTISDKTETNENNTLNILLQIEEISTYILTTQFAENYLIEYKLNNNTQIWYPELKKYLLDNYKEYKAIPNRKDPDYKKIESFKPYELTYKIFYEMAIRNDDVKKITNALNYLYNIRSLQKKEITINEINCNLDSKEKIYKISGTLNISNLPKDSKVFVSINASRLQCIETINDNKFEIVILLNKDTNHLDFFIAVGAENYQSDNMSFGLPLAHCAVSIRSTTTGVATNNKLTSITVKKDNEKYSISSNKDGMWLLDVNNTAIHSNKDFFRDKYVDFLQPEEHQIYLSTGVYFTNELIKELENELIEKYLIYPVNYGVNHPEKSQILLKRALNNSIDIQKLQSNPNYKHEDKYFFKEDEYDGYSVHQGILKDSDNMYDLSTIKHDSTKQVADYNVSNLQFNLNLPKEELLSYLKKIKDNYDNDNSILKSPLELLGEELGIESENIKNMKPMEWADTFYIYDYFKSNKNDNPTRKKDHIQESLNNYYMISIDKAPEVDHKDIQNTAKRFSKVNNSLHHLGIETITSRIQLMEKLIDKKKYKILTTKSKITEE